MRHQVVPRGLWAVLFFYDLPLWCHQDRPRKAFRLPDAPLLEQPQKQDAVELSESERSTVLFEHPDV